MVVMGTWKVETDRKPGIVWFELAGTMSIEEMRQFGAAAGKAIQSVGGAEFQIFCDIRALKVLSPECTKMFETAKGYSASLSNFRGSGVWVANSTTALQHKMSSVKGGVMKTELISDDEQALWAHLDKLQS